MKVAHYTETPAQTPTEDVVGVTLRRVIAPEDGAPNFTMRVFEVEPGGHTPSHSHEWEHEVFVLDGTGKLRSAKGEVSLGEGTVAFIPGGEAHQFVNDGSATLSFICVVPNM